MEKVRTRIAPSPTGDPHVGTAYIALFNRCFAHQHQGQFILRIEDTDQTRSTIKSEQEILNTLRWLGLNWDEGPDLGGDFGPYRQSERSHIYAQHIEILLANKSAFRCFCSAQRLQELRQQQIAEKTQPGYDGCCKNLSEEEVNARLENKEMHVVRMCIPEQGECVFSDVLRGEISISWQQVDMQVLIKSDGLPTYHFANVVDDHLMEITDVIRGEEWINSTPKHILLYQYFGWDAPRFYHMPLLRNPDKSKLSKRKNPTSIGYYADMGYLPEAMINYLGTMGWAMPNGEEKFTFQEMVENFDITRVSLGGPIFDIEKLDWLNGKYIREELSDEEFMARYSEWALGTRRVKQIVPLVKERVERFSDVAALAGFFFVGEIELKAADFSHKKLDTELTLQILQYSLWCLESLNQWNRDEIERRLMQLSNSMELKIRDFLFPVFIAISGKAVSTSVIDSIAILGLDMSRARFRNAVSVLGGISKKAMKALGKNYRKFASN